MSLSAPLPRHIPIFKNSFLRKTSDASAQHVILTGKEVKKVRLGKLYLGTANSAQSVTLTTTRSTLSPNPSDNRGRPPLLPRNPAIYPRIPIELTNAMVVWYNCLLLKNRTLTDHEKENLDRVNVRSVIHNGVDVMIGPKDSPFNRSMHVELTHHHHLDALLAMIACYVDPTVKSLNDYPVRHLQFAAVQRIVQA